ncbi:MAG: hypothetical protein RI897_4174 [Verrucomicrobiota bacterium]
MSGEVGVGEDDFIAVAHFGESFEEDGAEGGVDAFEHGDGAGGSRGWDPGTG